MNKWIEVLMSINWETVGATIVTFMGVILVVIKWLRKNISDVSRLMKDNVELKNSNIISQANIVSYNNLIQEFTEFKNTVYTVNRTNKALMDDNKKMKADMELMVKAHEEVVRKMLIEFTNKLKEEGVEDEVQL